MGDEKRVGDKDHTVTLYSPQSESVVRALERDGTCHSKKSFVLEKYGESAPIFVAVYDWFVKEAEKYLLRPPKAEYPYWAVLDKRNVDASAGGRVLRLNVPASEAIFFDLYDWQKLLCLQYLGETAADESRFRQEMADSGVHRAMDVVLTNFYPDLKRQVLESWQRLFRHHEKIKAGGNHGVENVQAALWRLKKEWIQ